MTFTDLTANEQRVWDAAATGVVVDLRVGDAAVDSPANYEQWSADRTVRADVIAARLIGDGVVATVPARALRLHGARIVGSLNPEAATLTCPFVLEHCSFEEAITLDEATVVSLCLGGSHVPAVRARQLVTRGDVRLDEGFVAAARIDLELARIGGDLLCTGGKFSNRDGTALNADKATCYRPIYLVTD